MCREQTFVRYILSDTIINYFNTLYAFEQMFYIKTFLIKQVEFERLVNLTSATYLNNVNGSITKTQNKITECILLLSIIFHIPRIVPVLLFCCLSLMFLLHCSPRTLYFHNHHLLLCLSVVYLQCFSIFQRSAIFGLYS